MRNSSPRSTLVVSLAALFSILTQSAILQAQAESLSRVAGPRVIVKPDGHLEAYYRLDNFELRQNTQSTAGGAWSGWSPVPAAPFTQGNPALASELSFPYTAKIYVENWLDHSLMCNCPLGLQPWTVQAAPVYSDPAAILNGGGIIDVFATLSNGTFISLNRPVFSMSSSDRAFYDSRYGWVEPQLVLDNTGNTNLLYVAHDRTLRAITFTASWAFKNLGGELYSNPFPVRRSDNRLQAFILGKDRAIWTISETSSGIWGAWQSLGGVLFNNPAAIVNSDGKLQVFALGQDGAIWHRKQTFANGSWGSWASLGGKLKGDPTVVRNSDGRLQVFAVGSLDSRIWYTQQTTPGGSWSAWVSMGPL